MPSPSDRIILPERGLTLLPPWPQAIVFADKRLENRGATVAGHIGAWRGMVALSQSKVWHWQTTPRVRSDDSALYNVVKLKTAGLIADNAQGFSFAEISIWSGKLVAVAELMDVLPPDRCEGDPWHVPGQHGLILGQVWEVEPTPIIGGRGCWYAGQCPQCDALQARDRPDGTCRRCGTRPKAGTNDGDGWRRPELKIIRECIL